MEKAIDISQNIKQIIHLMKIAKNNSKNQQLVNLIAVSKTKSVLLIKQAYDEGLRDFGENYVDEILQKANQLPIDIRWHFIGHIQSNKSKQICEIQNLYSIHSLDSLKLAQMINKQLVLNQRKDKVKVFIQLKTSDEDTKYGVPIENQKEIDSLIEFIMKSEQLQLEGLMTIGKEGDLQVFQQMNELKKTIEARNSAIQNLQLSMGMSGDFEQAVFYYHYYFIIIYKILSGSNNVRIGSLLFGQRDYSNQL